jgi:hypothetical protein
MKHVGFIKQHEGSLTFSKDIGYYTENTKPHRDRDKIIDYLKKGNLCVPLMGCVENVMDPLFNTDDYDDPSFIAYIAVVTDGEYFWPEYFVTYLEMYPNFKIDERFAKHAVANIENPPVLSEEKIIELEKEYLLKAGFK